MYIFSNDEIRYAILKLCIPSILLRLENLVQNSFKTLLAVSQFDVVKVGMYVPILKR